MYARKGQKKFQRLFQHFQVCIFSWHDVSSRGSLAVSITLVTERLSYKTKVVWAGSDVCQTRRYWEILLQLGVRTPCSFQGKKDSDFFDVLPVAIGSPQYWTGNMFGYTELTWENLIGSADILETRLHHTQKDWQTASQSAKPTDRPNNLRVVPVNEWPPVVCEEVLRVYADSVR